jgi:hypothetical protein
MDGNTAAEWGAIRVVLRAAFRGAFRAALRALIRMAIFVPCMFRARVLFEKWL